jgi:NADPH:quinone reductase-like Zn-dependent oxidoreductase
MLGLVNTPAGRAPVELQHVPEPEPAPSEALVAVRAFSLNRGELRSLRDAEPGWRPGQDVSGVVLTAAANGAGLAAGARVVALLDEFGWAERAAVPVHRMAELPDSVGFAEAATLPIAGLTALRTLRYGGPLLGQRVLITGATGGVGHLAVQLAARSGARVTAVAGRAESAAWLAGLGAAEVVQGIDKAQGRFALVLESVGGASLEGAVKRLEPKGTVVLFGNSSGESSTLGFGDFGEAQNARLQTFFSFSAEPEDRFAPDLALLVSLVADGSLKAQIGVERSWREIVQVLVDLRERRVNGKAVLRVD